MLYVFNSVSAETVFRGQILTSKVGPRAERVKCLVLAEVPANTTRWNNAVLMLAQRLRRWPNNKTSLLQSVVLAGV